MDFDLLASSSNEAIKRLNQRLLNVQRYLNAPSRCIICKKLPLAEHSCSRFRSENLEDKILLNVGSSSIEEVLIQLRHEWSVVDHLINTNPSIFCDSGASPVNRDLTSEELLDVSCNQSDSDSKIEGFSESFDDEEGSEDADDHLELQPPISPNDVAETCGTPSSNLTTVPAPASLSAGLTPSPCRFGIRGSDNYGCVFRFVLWPGPSSLSAYPIAYRLVLSCLLDSNCYKIVVLSCHHPPWTCLLIWILTPQPEAFSRTV